VIASLLTGYGDEAKIADRCANSLGIALDDNDLLAFSGCGKRGRKADNARADNQKIVCILHLGSVLTETHILPWLIDISV
jgi:hypothetical protein